MIVIEGEDSMFHEDECIVNDGHGFARIMKLTMIYKAVLPGYWSI